MKRLHLIAIIIVIALLSTGCASVTVTGKRFGSLPQDVRTFVQPNQVTLYPTPLAAWQALETGYRYQTDDWYISDKFGQVISGGEDTWLMPSEVQVLVNTVPHGMDCEDGAIWLTSALRKQGLDAWLCVGTVTLSSGVYGHAWCMVLADGVWTLYETTTGQTTTGLPCEYRLSWRTNGTTTWTNVLGIGSWMHQLSLPPDRLSELREVLRD
jgi:hypothetical protein